MCAILTVLEDIFYHIYICKTKNHIFIKIWIQSYFAASLVKALLWKTVLLISIHFFGIEIHIYISPSQDMNNNYAQYTQDILKYIVIYIYWK